jgi:phage terminase large subunit GpA-like protein
VAPEALAIIDQSAGWSSIQAARARLASSIRRIGPPPKMLVSSWADANRVIPKGAGPEEGRWDTSRAPFQRGMMDAILEEDVEEVVLMCSSQVGKTEVINNVLGYYIAQDPAPILVVQPTVEMAQAYSKERIAPMLLSSPALRDLVSEAKSRDSDNTIGAKRYPGGRLVIVGANAPPGLASRPIRILLCDEVDRFPMSAGAEGDPVSLARRRTSNFWNRKVVLTSSPTVRAMSRIETAFLASDQRRFFVPCPRCGAFQVLKWNPGDGRGGIVYDRDEREAPIEGSARYQCGECQKFILEEERPDMLANGEWRATNPGPMIAGFHIWSAYSPWVQWMTIVNEWHKAHGNPEMLKAFINTLLGETWEEDGEQQVDATSLKGRLEEFAAPVPSGVGALIAAVDVQGDRLEVLVNGFGAGEESWRVDHLIISGDPGTAEPWERLAEMLETEYQHESGRLVPITLAVIDSGGNHTEMVYDFCRGRDSRSRRRSSSGGAPYIFAIKGASGAREIVGRPSRSLRYKMPLYVVGVDTAKDVVFSRLKLRIEPGGRAPGYIHLPIETDDEFLEQLASERPIRVWRKGRGWVREWKKMRARNEAWDLEVYAVAGLHILGEAYVANLEKMAARLDEPPDAPREDARVRRSKGPRRNGFVDRWKE